MVDYISCIQGFAQALVIHCPRISTATLSNQEGCTGLLALQPVPCPSRSCVGREGHGHFAYRYTMGSPFTRVPFAPIKSIRNEIIYSLQ